jgi:TatD DNase family protein
VIDSHAHIDAPDFADDREEMMARARAAGVEGFIAVGAAGDLATAERTVAFAEANDDVWATVGVHPHEASALEPRWWPVLRELAQREVVVGIGESGLDYYYDSSPRPTQQRAFAEHLELARELDLPIVCHIRDAHEDAKAILRESGIERGVIHCFTGGPDDARDYVAMGMHISFSGIITFRSAGQIREAVAEVPHDRILIETDCPWLAPVPKRGKRNEPAFLPFTAAVVAEEAGLSSDELGRMSAANTRTLFTLTG